MTELSLRDYFAVHCQEPGQADLADAAGMKIGSAPGWYDRRSQEPVVWVQLGTGTAIQFKDWWNSLTVHERAYTVARARYIVADAMIKAQSAPPPPPEANDFNDLAKVALALNPFQDQ